MEETDGSDGTLIFVVCILSFLGATAGGVTGFGTSLVFISLWRVIQAAGWLHLGEDFVRSDSVLCITVFVLAFYLTVRTWKDAYPNLVIGLLPGLAALQFVGAFVVLSDEEDQADDYFNNADSVLRQQARKVIGFLLLTFILLRGLAMRSQIKSEVRQKDVEAGMGEPRHQWEEQIVCSYFCPERYPEATPRRASSHTVPNMFISFNSARLFWGQIPPNEQGSGSLSVGRVAASIPTLLRSWENISTWLCALPYSGIFWGALVTGCLAGMLGGSFGTGDTTALVYFTMLPLSKSQLRASFVVALCLTQPLQIVSLANQGMFQEEDWPLYVGAPVFGILGVLLGDWIHRFVNKTFTIIVSLFLVLAASVAFLAPMNIDTNYGVTVLAMYVLVVVVFVVLALWDQITTRCWSSVSCIEEQSHPLAPIRHVKAPPLNLESEWRTVKHEEWGPGLSTIQDNSTLSGTGPKSHNRTLTNDPRSDIWSNWSTPSDCPTYPAGYGAVDTRTQASKTHTGSGSHNISAGSHEAGLHCSDYYRGIPYVSVAMRQTGRDKTLLSTGLPLD